MCAVGCGSSRAEDTTWRFDLDFRSVPAAVSVDTVQAFAFARDDGALDCPMLLAMLQRGQELPPPAARSDETPLCAVTSADGGRLRAPYGRYWLLVLARRGGRSWMVGCSGANVTSEAATPAPRVPLIPFDNTVAIPRTECATLTAKCAGGCS